MGQECTLQTTNRVEVLVLLCREVRLFLSRHGDGGLFWFSIENPQMFKLLWILFFAQANKDIVLIKKVPDGDGRTQAGV